MCELLGIDKTRTTPFRPQSDGQVERFNATLQKIIATTAERCHWDWDIMTPYAVMAYRATKHSSTGLTPNMMPFRWEITEPVDLVAGLPPDPDNTTTTPSYVVQLREQLELSHHLAREALGKYVERAKRQTKMFAESNTKSVMQYGSWSKAQREQRIKCGSSCLPTRVRTLSWVYWTTWSTRLKGARGRR